MSRPVIVAMSRALCPDDPRYEDMIVRIEVGIRPIETYTLINRNCLTWLSLSFCPLTHPVHLELKSFEFCPGMETIFGAFGRHLVAPI